MRTLLLCTALLLIWPACASAGKSESFASPEEVLALREIQTRRFEAEDPVRLLKAAMAAMQDLQFVIDDAEPALGLAVGTSLARGSRVQVSVFVRPVGDDRYSVRASVHRGPFRVDEPRVYRDFFDAIGVVMALP